MASHQGSSELPLVPMAETLIRAGVCDSVTIKGSMRGNPVENFTAFVERPMADIASRSVGAFDHLSDIYVNSFLADYAVRDTAAKLEKEGLQIHPRANAAGVNVILAAQMVDAAVLMYLRPEPIHARAVLVIARIALEVAARGAWIAMGSGDEVEASSKEWIRPKRMLPSLARLVSQREPSAASPKRVYFWLSEFAHMNLRTLAPLATNPPEQHGYAYASIAYSAWTSAIVAEYVVHGNVSEPDRFAKWPTVWPDPLPWAS